MIKKLYNKFLDAQYKVMVFGFAAISATEAAIASCNSGNQQGIGGVACSIDQNFSGLGDMMLGGSFLGGVGFVGAGILKLKEASQQGQAKYSDGIWRLGAGSALIALPTMAAVGKTSLFANSGSTVNNSNSVTW